MKTLQEVVSEISPPSGWQRRKLKHVLRLRRENKNTGLIEQNLLSLSYGKIIRRDINRTEGLVPASYEGYQIVEPGDIILRLTDLQNDKRSLRQGLVKERGIITSAYDAVYSSSEEYNPEYFYFFLYALDLSKYYYSLGGGVRQSIGYNDFPNDWISVPPLSEQKFIVANMKSQLSTINELVNKLGGNRSLQVAVPGSMLSALYRLRNTTIVRGIFAGGLEAKGEFEQVD